MPFPASVVIVGGSVTGLLQGLALKRNGTDVIILEKDPSTHRLTHESGVHLGPSVVALLKKYDASRSPAFVPTTHVTATWGKREKVIDSPSERATTNWGCLYQILRANFDGQTSMTVLEAPEAKLGDGRVEYRSGKVVTSLSYERENGQVTVQCVDATTGNEETIVSGMVVAADGIHSTVRELVGVPVREEYAGYIAWRGTVPEEILAPSTLNFFQDRMSFVTVSGTYFVVYIIPTENGDVEPGTRLVNWVWYTRISEDSPQMKEIFTDNMGNFHRNTVPQGLVQISAWSRQIERYRMQMVLPMAEVISKTTKPFVTKVSEVSADASSFYDGRLVLMGDAYTTYRTHLGMASEQSAWHIMQMEKFWRDEITMEEKDKALRLYANEFILLNRAVGFIGLGMVGSLAKTLAQYIWFKAMVKAGRA